MKPYARRVLSEHSILSDAFAIPYPVSQNSISFQHSGKKTCYRGVIRCQQKKKDRARVASVRNAGFFEYVGTLFELQRFDVDLVLAFPFGHPTNRSNDGHSDEGSRCWGRGLSDENVEN